MNLDALQVTLGDLDCGLVFAESGREALRHVLNREFALILMDVMMPEMDGFETAEIIRQRSRSRATPIIFLTAAAEASTRVFEGYQAGAVDYLFKPLDPQILRAKVNVFLDLERSHEQLKELLNERECAQAKLAAYTEELRLNNEQLKENFKAACELQRTFLPTCESRFPTDAVPECLGLRFVHRYMPTESVGGDFSCVLPLSDTEVVVLIGDVMGHGVRAALVTAIVRGLLQQSKADAADPGRFLDMLNRPLIGILPQSITCVFASAFCLFVDITNGNIRYASAGHPSPLLLRPEADAVEALHPLKDEKFGLALGILKEATYVTHEERVCPSDSVVFFTDGLFELEGVDADFFDQKRLLEAVRQRVHMPLEKLFSDLLLELRHFSIHSEFDDDVCLIGMEVR